MKKLLLTSLLLLFALTGRSQTAWVDTLYSIQTTSDISYGSATDFAGNVRDLQMDISVPVGDNNHPSCGRPLMVLVHGGAFLVGTKEDVTIRRMREDFAKRGYVTASVNYRLGMFQTNAQVNCNISALGAEWNCLNMTDTTEWYRAYYRGVQDVKGAVRYLVDHAADYDIDVSNIFVTGESAGAFIAMGVGYIDHPAEVQSVHTGNLGSVPAPHSIYESECVQGYGLDTSIASMDLSRPDLGGYQGDLNYPASGNFRIVGVGNYFGAVFNTIFHSYNGDAPALYIYHQPNDLLVPYNTNKIFAGYAYCATQWPFNCAYIINRPTVMGGESIRDELVNLMNLGDPIPYLFDSTTNTADCATQINNPATTGHAIDNYWLRTTNMAVFFAGQMDTCGVIASRPAADETFALKLYPNPAAPGESVFVEGIPAGAYEISLFDAQGRLLLNQSEANLTKGHELHLPAVPEGLYYLRLRGASLQLTRSLLIRR